VHQHKRATSSNELSSVCHCYLVEATTAACSASARAVAAASALARSARRDALVGRMLPLLGRDDDDVEAITVDAVSCEIVPLVGRDPLPATAVVAFFAFADPLRLLLAESVRLVPIDDRLACDDTRPN
jgi:hypothetical protein